MSNQIRTNDEVIEAIEAWRGNVKAAADQLGMRPKSLRERLKRLKVDLATIRNGAPYQGVVTRTTRTDPSRPRGARPARSQVSGSGMSGDPQRQRTSPPTLPTMNATSPIPFRVSRDRNRPPGRLEPVNQDVLREARLKVIGRFGVELNETALLNQFFEESFAAWLEEKLAKAGDDR